MDPITLGLAAAALFAAKVIGRMGERTGDKVVDTVTPVRDHIAHLLESGDPKDVGALEQVERSPDSRIAVNALAAAIADAARRDPVAAAPLADIVAQSQSVAGDHQGAAFQVNLSDHAAVERVFQANHDINFRDE